MIYDLNNYINDLGASSGGTWSFTQCDGTLPLQANPPTFISASEVDFTGASNGTYIFSYSVFTNGNLCGCSDLSVFFEVNNTGLTIGCLSCPEPITFTESLENGGNCIIINTTQITEVSLDGVNWIESNKICI